MLMMDVNVLVYAHREEMPQHKQCAQWLREIAGGLEPFALSEFVLHGFLRVVTNGKIFDPPSTTEEAFRFIDTLIEMPGCTMIRAGARHWAIFRGLCEGHKLKGKLVADAAHAALAIESGCEWVTGDSDFARFAPPLRWRLL